MPSVAYFSNQFATNQGHGVARYAHHLFEAFHELSSPFDLIPVAAWSDRSAESLKALHRSTNLQLLPWGRRLTPLVWNMSSYLPIENGVEEDIDIVHAVSLGYRISTRKPYLVTVHDIGPLTHPEFFTDKPPWIMARALSQAVKKAERFICVSQTTADDLVFYCKKKYGINVFDRIDIALEGVSNHFFEAPSSETEISNLDINLNSPFFLAVGKLSPRKNLSSILESLSIVKNDIPHHLIAVGGDGWAFKDTKNKVSSLGLDHRVHFPGYVSDKTLKILYRKATGFIYPSLFEGFGLTVLEAMASSCPVITSNLSSLPEVAGDAALLINPMAPEEIAEAMLCLATEKELANSLRRKGIERAKTFTWSKCAIEIEKAYRKVLG